jgi:hypothetical protein
MDQESPVLVAIDQLAELPEGWDSYGAPKIAETPRRMAKDCLNQVQRILGAHYANPLVGPTPEGGVYLVWRKERGSEIDVLCSPAGVAQYVVLAPHRQVVGGGPLYDVGYFALQVLKRIDL